MSLRALLLLAVAACSTRTPNEQTRQDPVVTDAVIDSETCGPPAPLAACETPVAGTKVTAHQIARVTGQAVLVTSPPNDPRLFVIEKNGRIRIIEDGVLQLTPFIDLSSQLVVSSEQGLLGLAFHPNYNCNGEFFVYYTTSNANVVARCTVSDSNPNLADPTCTTVISIPDFAPNHNGGMIEFGADGYLYIGTGDGGQYGDPRRNAQALWDGSPFGNTVAWLGKILRIDVDHPAPGSQYGIPADNPYAAGGGKPEIFISGVRNPWRWSFDRATGDMWIGDVGQNQTEELNVLKAGEQAGKNLGWSVYEGNTCCKTQWDKCSQVATQPCDATDKTFPLDTRSHSQGWISIIAGQVYRGTCYPDLVGWHFYTDYADNQLHKARLLPTGELEVVDLPGTIPTGVSSIHADARGELYMTDTSGFVYHLEASP